VTTAKPGIGESKQRDRMQVSQATISDIGRTGKFVRLISDRGENMQTSSWLSEVFRKHLEEIWG
jgi:hypothetical protein